MNFRTAVAIATAVAATPLALAGPASADTADTISGVVFHDLDGDGVRQAGEPGIAHQFMHIAALGVTVESDADGRYRFTGLAPGQSYDVLSWDRDRSHNQGWSPDREGGSRFGWTTGEARIAAGDQDADSGFVTASVDYIAADIRVNGPQEQRYDVGDEVDVIGTVMATGNVTAGIGARLTLPEGVRVKRVLGDFDVFGDPANGDAVGGWTTSRLEPGTTRQIGATIVVEKPVDAGLITLTAVKENYSSTDVNTANDVVTHRFDAGTLPATEPMAATPTTTTAPTSPTTMPTTTQAAVTPIAAKTEPSAHTGLSALGLLGLGGSLLAGGGAALWGMRRRKS